MGKRNLKEFRMDADYRTQINRRLGGAGSKQIPVFRCPIYLKWAGVKERAGSGSINKRTNAYLNVDVCDDWLSFMSFRGWVLEQPCWEGLALDKDLILSGNQMYAPEYCAFVPSSINSLLIAGNRSSHKGHPFGVSLISESTKAAPHFKYVAQMYRDGKAIRKYTETAEQAHTMWQENRESGIRNAVSGWVDHPSYRQDIADNLLAVADKLLYNRLEGVETFDLSF